MSRRVLKGIGEDDLGDSAAALTYFAALSIFPALALLISALALFGTQGTVNDLLAAIDDVAPASVTDTVRSSLNSLIDHKGASGVALGVSLLLTLFSSSGYLGAFDRAAARMRGASAGPGWKARPRQMLFALALVLLLAISLPSLLVTGSITEALAHAFGFSLSSTVFELVKWPLLLAGGTAMIVGLYKMSPHLRERFRALLPGALLAVALWILASALFSVYVAKFSNYSLTYGSLAGAIVFMVWLYFANFAVLLGAKLNTELQDSGGAQSSSIV